MSKIKPDRSQAKAVFNGFEGLGTPNKKGKPQLADMINFRLLSNGTLQKRCGWRSNHMLPSDIRGYWSGKVGTSSYSFAVAGSTVYRLSGTQQTAVSTLQSDFGSVQFVCYAAHLYLLDGTAIYVLRENDCRFLVAQGYVPLFGLNWHPTKMGDVYESRNLFTRRLRVHYYNLEGSATFSLPFYADSVDRVWVDGHFVYDFNLSSAGNSVQLSTPGMEVEIAFTISLSDGPHTQMPTATQAFCDRFGAREVLLLYGMQESQHLFCSVPVDNVALNGSLAYYTDSDPLYFTANTHLLTDANHPITSVFSHHGRILAFHARGAFSIQVSEEDSTVEYYPLLSNLGCTAKNMSLTVHGDPVILNEGGIFRLSSPRSDPDLFTVTPISQGIPALHDAQFYDSAITCQDTARGELWFRNPYEDAGTVWIYQIGHGVWYRFQNIRTRLFFERSGQVGFAYDNLLCYFSESADTDYNGEIEAVLETEDLHFDDPENFKRTLRASLVCQGIENHVLTVDLTTERQTRQLRFLRQADGMHGHLDLRASLGRFRFLRVRITAYGSGRPQFSRLALYAN